MDRPTVVMFHIDSETLNDLSHANDELIQGLHWLLARRDLATFEKLYPIVRRITDLILAILEGAFPEMSRVSDTLNRLSDEINERMSKASTQEEFLHTIDALMSALFGVARSRLPAVATRVPPAPATLSSISEWMYEPKT